MYLQISWFKNSLGLMGINQGHSEHLKCVKKQIRREEYGHCIKVNLNEKYFAKLLLKKNLLVQRKERLHEVKRCYSSDSSF